MEHPFGGSWGYHVTSYFAPTRASATPTASGCLIDRLHQAGIGVILDWVPGHFATDDWALARFDGTPLYEHADPQRGEHPEWGSYIFDFGRQEVRNFLVANAVYWLEEFHADGLRVDGVASMLYLDYSREEGEWTPNIHGGRENLEAVAVPAGGQRHLLQAGARRRHDRRGVDGLAAGHRPTTSAAASGFGFKWNMGWMHDSLGYIAHDPIHRAVPPPPDDVLDDVRRTPRTTCCRSRTTRSCTARARCCARCPATAGSSSPTCAPTSPTCGRTPASS